MFSIYFDKKLGHFLLFVFIGETPEREEFKSQSEKTQNIMNQLESDELGYILYVNMLNLAVLILILLSLNLVIAYFFAILIPVKRKTLYRIGIEVKSPVFEQSGTIYTCSYEFCF